MERWTRSRASRRVGVALVVLAVVAAAAAAAVAAVALAAAPDDDDVFRIAEPGYVYRFPRDHGAHFDYRTEWWYYTGQLKVVDGEPDEAYTLGFQLTFFRSGVDRRQPPRPSVWAVRDLYFAHLAITGGMAASDSLIQQMIGHGVAAKVSARLGEGVLNGLLTARLGLAAIDVTRPLPFTALPRPSLSDVASGIVRTGKSADQTKAD